MNRRQVLTLALVADIACWSGLSLFIVFLVDIWG